MPFCCCDIACRNSVFWPRSVPAGLRSSRRTVTVTGFGLKKPMFVREPTCRFVELPSCVIAPRRSALPRFTDGTNCPNVPPSEGRRSRKIRDVAMRSRAADTRTAPVPLTLKPELPAMSSSTAVPRGGMSTVFVAVAVVFALVPAAKYSSSATVGVSYDGLKTRASVTKVCPSAFVTRPATARSLSTAGASCPRISPPPFVELWTLT
jgi:hypothetical protein